jgi:predicted metal-dependent HD superfamily phosphohydrolase
MSYQVIGSEIEKHVISLFQNNPNGKLIYHNLEHTRRVVQRTEEIASFYKQIDEETLFICRAAAWFHDTGYLFGGAANHEQESVHLMTRFFLAHDYSPAFAEKIMHTIMATKPLAVPFSPPEKILCDADTYHFGTAEFKITDQLVKREIELTTGSAPTDWTQHTIAMLKNHRFYTSYCIDRLESGKRRNIAWLESLLTNMNRGC